MDGKREGGRNGGGRETGGEGERDTVRESGGGKERERIKRVKRRNKKRESEVEPLSENEN